LDLDAHCGGGTAALIEDERRVWQIDVSVNGYDGYRGSGRMWLEIVREGADYLATVRRGLDQADQRGPGFDLCLYNAGMDPHEGCPQGGMRGITREVLGARERMVFDWCHNRTLPIAFVLAGGYVGPHLDERGLVDLHRLTMSVAAEAGRTAKWPRKSIDEPSP
jgi:acetoin utilization deacetylase AcuC-like enzyme